jgi:hypothetical protein
MSAKMMTGKAMARISWWRNGVLLVAALAMWVGGCGITPSTGSARIQSIEHRSVLAADLPVRVYSFKGLDSADVYMTDLPPQVWNAGADVSEMSGLLVHVHMFVRPEAGHTPIENTASTAIIRCVVLAKGEIGVYGGAGFFVNDDTPGDKTFGGGVHNGTVRLLSATGGFVDRLGPSTFSGAVSGNQDQATAEAMERAEKALIEETKPVEEAGQASSGG